MPGASIEQKIKLSLSHLKYHLSSNDNGLSIDSASIDIINGLYLELLCFLYDNNFDIDEIFKLLYGFDVFNEFDIKIKKYILSLIEDISIIHSILRIYAVNSEMTNLSNDAMISHEEVLRRLCEINCYDFQFCVRNIGIHLYVFFGDTDMPYIVKKLVERMHYILEKLYIDKMLLHMYLLPENQVRIHLNDMIDVLLEHHLGNKEILFKIITNHVYRLQRSLCECHEYEMSDKLFYSYHIMLDELFPELKRLQGIFPLLTSKYISYSEYSEYSLKLDELVVLSATLYFSIYNNNHNIEDTSTIVLKIMDEKLKLYLATNRSDERRYWSNICVNFSLYVKNIITHFSNPDPIHAKSRVSNRI